MTELHEEYISDILSFISTVESVKGRKLNSAEFNEACTEDIREGWKAEVTEAKRRYFS